MLEDEDNMATEETTEQRENHLLCRSPSAAFIILSFPCFDRTGRSLNNYNSCHGSRKLQSYGNRLMPRRTRPARAAAVPRFGHSGDGGDGDESGRVLAVVSYFATLSCYPTISVAGRFKTF